MDLADYDDPEEDDWKELTPPNPNRLPDNTASWGPIYYWRGLANPRQHRVSIAITREISAPWRRGLGLTVKLRRGNSRAVGLWFKGKPPKILQAPPDEKDWREVVSRSNELAVDE